MALTRQGLSVLQSATETEEGRELELSLHLVLGNALLVTVGYGDPEVERIYRRARDLYLRENGNSNSGSSPVGLYLASRLRSVETPSRA